jgi:CubicO group peptidase (beta-lactamase class C family)
VKAIIALVALAVAGVLAEGARRALPVLSIGAGLKAGHMCSAVFLAGRVPDAVLRDELADLHPKLDFVPDPSVDRESRSVSVSLLLGLIVRRAVWRERVGCTVLPAGASVEDLAPVASAAIPRPPGDPTEIPWPEGDLIPEQPLPPGVDEKRLGQAVEAAFSRAGERPSRTIGVVVVYRDRIVAERYAPGFGAHTQYRSWSSAKSIVGALIGILVGEGRLELDAPAPIPEWQAPGDRRGQIHIAHLLHMSSGLESGGAWTPEAYWNGIDTAAAVSRTALETAPGTRWKYSNYDTLLLVRAMREAMGDHAAYLAFPYRALLHRIGMRDTIPELDPYGNYILSSQVYTSTRDLARLGLLYLNDGTWQGERILPEGWVAYTTTPAPAALSLPEDHEARAGYGAQFWLYGRDPRLPADTYSTSGARGQHATIVPSRRLVVARMGLDPILESSWDQRGFVAQVLEAIIPDSEGPTRTREQH